MELYEFNMKVKDAEKLTHALATVAEMSHVVETRKSATGKYVDTACTGGQPITRAVYDRIRTFSSKLYIMFFGSEPLCVSVNEINDGDDFAPFDAGFPVEGVEIRILDEELREVGAGVSGTIVIRSPTLFTRYVGEPDRTDAVWWRDGWFISADAGYLSPEGRVFVFGRSGDVISRGIVLTYPAWVEKPISSHPEVLEIMAVPVPDDINVENICACVVKKPGSDLTETAVKQLVKDSMTSDGSYYITVDHVLFFDEALPKLSRKKLGQLAAVRLGLLAF
ncbi:putative acyl--CoA ligase YdaB isoform X2 [Physella acuta]|uniref:putative acyl--CoA ligase YdaB isoform X1 n=1 Tax=Physella acuta TaxID=109671 RepID=UPI0027DDAB3B|nr:putative acyl--CoA ligase YdaB isoform X1 [Physella acuta]XP_059179531.1 putative acyl--CoA ligase YdaB isoform X2 [Physella acuta]